MSLLQVEGISVQFGGIRAVQDVSFSVETGQVYTLIGPNGAGKTTLFNLLSRLYPLSQGRMLFDGEDFSFRAAHEIAALGIARTFQNIELFDKATVLENLLAGAYRGRSTGLLAEALFTREVRVQERKLRRIAEEIIEFLRLHRHRDETVGLLPYGARKVVEIGRALCSKPRLLLLDEPSSGLTAEERRDMAFWIEDIREVFGVTVLMIEHDMSLMSRVSDRVLVLNEGKVIAEGTPAEVKADQAVIEAYLGRSRA